MVLTFTGTNVHHARGLKILSVLVTAVENLSAVLQIFPYAVTDGEPIFSVSTVMDTTTQVNFDGLLISSGVTLVAGEGVLSYVVEYADL